MQNMHSVNRGKSNRILNGTEEKLLLKGVLLINFLYFNL